MKHRIIYYSDCPFFAGCENMIANFLNDQTIHENFSVAFAYNYSEKYEQGLNSRVSNTCFERYPLRLITQITTYRKPLNTFRIWALIHKAIFAFYMLIHKYLSIVINTIILFRFYTKHKFQILHINNGGYPAAYSCYSAVIAGKMAGINNIIYVVNNIATDYKQPFRWLDYPIDFFIKKWVTFFITGSKHAGERLRNILDLDVKKQLTINNGSKRRAVTLSKEKFKEKYLIPQNKLVASVVANLEKRKGHIFLLEAILKMKQETPNNLNTFFIFEGVGAENGNLAKYIEQNSLGADVLMVDYIPDIFNLLNASDFVILPSIANEDFPNVVIEAMSLGKPVVGTDIAGIPEQIENNKTGMVVKPANAEALKLAIVKLTSNPFIFQQFSIEAKNKFDASFEKSISINKYINLYKSLL